MNEKIVVLCVKNKIDLLDIIAIQNIALQTQQYDLLVYLNNSVKEYISYAKKYMKQALD